MLVPMPPRHDGKASHHTNDFFVLMKDHGAWKFLSSSYTTHPLENNLEKDE
jgi:hypothetical protein